MLGVYIVCLKELILCSWQSKRRWGLGSCSFKKILSLVCMIEFLAKQFTKKVSEQAYISIFSKSNFNLELYFIIKTEYKRERHTRASVCGSRSQKPRKQSRRTVTRPSADCQTTFFRRFNQIGKILKKSLNSHATVVGGHATFGRLSNNFFSTFQANRKFFEKVAERSRDSRRRSRDRRPTVNNFFFTFQANRKFFEKCR